VATRRTHTAVARAVARAVALVVALLSRALSALMLTGVRVLYPAHALTIALVLACVVAPNLARALARVCENVTPHVALVLILGAGRVGTQRRCPMALTQAEALDFVDIKISLKFEVQAKSDRSNVQFRLQRAKHGALGLLTQAVRDSVLMPSPRTISPSSSSLLAWTLMPTFVLSWLLNATLCRE